MTRRDTWRAAPRARPLSLFLPSPANSKKVARKCQKAWAKFKAVVTRRPILVPATSARLGEGAALTQSLLSKYLAYLR